MPINRFTNLLLCLAIFLLAGCAVSNQITKTQRSSIEQELLVRAFERAMASLDTQKLKDKSVAVDFYGLTPDKDFAKEYFTAWLQSQRVRIASDPKQAQLRLKVFASVLAVDQGQSFVGTPAFTVPLIGFVMPEVPLFKNIEHSGHAEIKISMADNQTGDFIDESAPVVGKAQHDDYTILIVVHFTRSDLEKQRWDLGPG
jgi:hypothetical protein